ncbi:glycosyltransferase family 2 protein [Candidatus Saccharibacteria bacterium]|nr:glycosyltransferase family 2 protein [Candidatus Saccharibacteria bacterium]
MDVSVIIPVYNSQKYLARCLNSVIRACEIFGKKCELILIDNKSTDDSLAILRKYQKKRPDLIRVLQCSTPGAGAVRNMGAREAKGTFIWFVDADDEITGGSLRQLVAEAKKTDADLVTLGLTKVYPDGHKQYIPAIHADDPEFKSKFIRNELGPVQVLIRRPWYISHNFEFMEGCIHEDMDLMPALILYTDKLASIDQSFYVYYQNESSTLHPTEWSEKYFDIFPVLTHLINRFKAAGGMQKYHDELEWFFVWNLLMDSAEYFRGFSEGRTGFKRSREMLHEYFPHWRKNRFFKKVNFRTKLKILLNYYR